MHSIPGLALSINFYRLQMTGLAGSGMQDPQIVVHVFICQSHQKLFLGRQAASLWLMCLPQVMYLSAIKSYAVHTMRMELSSSLGALILMLGSGVLVNPIRMIQSNLVMRLIC